MVGTLDPKSGWYTRFKIWLVTTILLSHPNTDNTPQDSISNQVYPYIPIVTIVELNHILV